MLHIGAGTRVLPKAYEKNGKPRPTDLLGGGENLRVKDYMVLSFAPQMFLSAMVFDGVFERFPDAARRGDRAGRRLGAGLPAPAGPGPSRLPQERPERSPASR